MSQPASKTTRVILVCLCLLGLAVGLFWCGRRARVAKQEAKEMAWEKNAARLVMTNEGTCEWLITIWPEGATEGKEWNMPVGKSAETMLTAGEYQVEQKFVAAEGSPQARRLVLVVEAGQIYRWRLVNLFSGDAAEWRVPVGQEAAR